MCRNQVTARSKVVAKSRSRFRVNCYHVIVMIYLKEKNTLVLTAITVVTVKRGKNPGATAVCPHAFIYVPPITPPEPPAAPDKTLSPLTDLHGWVHPSADGKISPSHVTSQSHHIISHHIRSFPLLAAAWQTSTWGEPMRDTRDRWVCPPVLFPVFVLSPL